VAYTLPAVLLTGQQATIGKDRDTMTFQERLDSLYSFDILGTYDGETETVDTFDTREEARTMLGEYRLAFGPSWSLRIKRTRK